MAKAVLLAIFTLCLTSVSHIAAAGSNSLSCNPGETTPHKIGNVGTYELVCPKGTTLAPDAPDPLSDQAGVFSSPDGVDDDDSNPRDCDSIGNIVPGACFGKIDGKDVVTIPQLPHEPRTFYLYCAKDSVHQSSGGVTDSCVIAIVVAASRRLGPNTCSVRGSRIRLAIEKSNETAVFFCGDGRTLQPQDPKKALDEGCAKEVGLPATVELTTKPTKPYEVTVSELPKEKTTICYVCAKTVPGDSTPDRCEVTISIAASNASGALVVGVAAHAAAAVGLTVTFLLSWR